MPSRLPPVLLAGLVLVAAACGTEADSEDDRAGEATSTATASPEEPSVTPPQNPTTPPGDEPSIMPPKASMLTISGTVEEGVERGCLLLQGYLLIVNDPAHQNVLVSSPRVEVTGYVDESVLSYCQQGTPLVVTSIRAL
jgi:hypothetical protein